MLLAMMETDLSIQAPFKCLSLSMPVSSFAFKMCSKQQLQLCFNPASYFYPLINQNTHKYWSVLKTTLSFFITV